MSLLPNHFYGLLDCLAGQFFNTKSKFAECLGKDFGTRIISDAKDYFSVAIIPRELPGDRAVLGVLIDDSAHIPSRNGFTFTIFVDLAKIPNDNECIFRLFSIIILAHEICHFSFYYELFLKLGGNTGIVAHSNFTHTVSIKLVGAVTQEQDNTSQSIFDEHNLEELLGNCRRYSKKHFSKGKETEIDYIGLFDSFRARLQFDKLMNTYLKNISNS